MSDPMKDAWNEVSEGFAKLGDLMKDRYRSGAADAEEEAAEPSGGGGQQLREALERLVASGRDVGQRSVDVIRDADVNAQAKDAAQALNDALAATVDMIGSQIGQLFGRGESSSTTAVDDDPDALAVKIDQQMEDAEGGVEASTLDAPDGEVPPP